MIYYQEKQKSGYNTWCYAPSPADTTRSAIQAKDYRQESAVKYSTESPKRTVVKLDLSRELQAFVVLRVAYHLWKQLLDYEDLALCCSMCR